MDHEDDEAIDLSDWVKPDPITPIRFDVHDWGYQGTYGVSRDEHQGYDAIVELPIEDPFLNKPTWIFRAHGDTRQGAVNNLKRQLERYNIKGVELKDEQG